MCGACGASLESATAALVALRAEREAETAALAELDRAPEAERAARLTRMAREHPHWQQVRRRMASMPPPPVGAVHVELRGGEVQISWPRSDGVDAYLVERVDAGRTRVLGRTAVTTWSDVLAPAEDTLWQVRAMRGETPSAPSTAQLPRTLREVAALADVPVVLSWQAPAGVRVILDRVDGDVTRRLSVDPGGYRDRHVARGRTYEYRVSLEGQEDPPAILYVTAGAGGRVLPGSAPPPPPAPANEVPPITGVRAAREPDGRVRLTWTWPHGITEAFVVIGDRPTQSAGGAGRKVTNMRYELDAGALLADAPSGAHITVFGGRRDGAGALSWGPAADGSRAIAP